MEKTKVTFKIFSGRYKELANQLDGLFIKRDAFLEHLLLIEMPHLKEALDGKVNSSFIRAHINKAMDKKRRTTSLTVALRTSTAQKLRSILDEHYVSRDAFINRIILFMLMNEAQLNALGIAPLASDAEKRVNFVDAIPTSPFPALKYIIEDPLFLARESLNLSGENMYLMDLSPLEPQRRFDINAMTACYLPETYLTESKSEQDDDLMSL
jgi:hypothetical protein